LTHPFTTTTTSRCLIRSLRLILVDSTPRLSPGGRRASSSSSLPVPGLAPSSAPSMVQAPASPPLFSLDGPGAGEPSSSRPSPAAHPPCSLFLSLLSPLPQDLQQQLQRWQGDVWPAAAHTGRRSERRRGRGEASSSSAMPGRRGGPARSGFPGAALGAPSPSTSREMAAGGSAVSP